MRKIAILGNGVAGITAARHIRKRSDDPILVISAESDHFFSRTALMYVYMGHLSYAMTKPYEDFFWRKNRIDLLRAEVSALDPAGRRLLLADGGEVPYDVLLLATGSRSRKLGWPGQDLKGVQGLYSLQDLEAMEESTRGIERAAIAGGGLIGVEMAEMLHSRGIGVTFLVREKSWMERIFPAEESAMVGDEIAAHGIDLRFGVELEEALADVSGRIRAVRTTGGDEVPCQFLGLTVGVSPNVEFLRGKAGGLEIDQGILVDDQLRTSLENVYAAGDCAQLRQPRPGRLAVEPLWYVARRMGETVAHTICGQPLVYDPGGFFNSAKFFDLEWQVYGRVPARCPEGEDSIFWRHPRERKSLRIQFRREDQAVLGFFLMGIRYRHELCDAWIAQGKTLREILPDLAAANFDPEFYRRHEEDLLEVCRRRFPGDPPRLRRKRGLASFLSLLRRDEAAR
jgi:3-phenylpropionate/trans-cinnamate dioxygenase ferredoxin reductase subunit